VKVVDVSTLPFRKLEHYQRPEGFTATDHRTVGQVAHPRLPSLDMLRGLVMVLMTLDHARDFFSGSSFDPRDVNDPVLFLTRWITHFCAPVFVFIAGVAAGLRRDELDDTKTLARYLVTRGFWLVVLEFSVVRVGWTFDPGGTVVFAQVIWALGVSMMVLGALIYLHRSVLAVLAIGMIVGHNLLDGVHATGQDLTSWLWMIAHQPGALRGDGATVYVLYPLVPWISVMAAGYVFAPIMHLPATRRRRQLARFGAALTLAFVALRATNWYGDPEPWSPQATLTATLLSFVNCEKYPPSLLYLMMTIGPALVALAMLDGVVGAPWRWLDRIGHTPLLYYVAHIYVLHALAVGVAWSTGQDVEWLINSSADKPAGWGYSLPSVYVVAGLVVVALYPLCRWFGALRQRRHDWWLSYL
jgi:uncharacterized membrane protein